MLMYRFAELFVVSTFLLFAAVHSQIVFPNPTDSNGNAIRPTPRPSCDANSYCTQIRRCRPLASLPNWRTAGQSCGSGSGGSRRVCCPRPGQPRPPSDTPRPPSNTPRPPSNTPSPTFNPPAPRTPNCGESKESQVQVGYVMGGFIAAEGAWPWMAVITSRSRSGTYNPMCTGFLIDRRHVLTAAHCFDRPNQPDMYSTRIGSVLINQGEVYSISNIAIPEGYVRGRYYDDIALLTLTREVNTPDISPICLPNEEIVRRNLVNYGTTIAGWGSVSPESRDLSNELRQLSEIPVVSMQQCNDVYRSEVTSFGRQFPRGIDGGFICAGFPEGQRDACGGDSGGPLMFQSNNQWFAVGIVSFGYSCGRPGIPGGYTRISSYLRWIRENLRN